MKPRIKLLFVLPTLGAGGAERILSFLAKNINKNNFESTLLIIGLESEAVFSLENTRVKFLNKKRVLFGIPAIITFLLDYKPNIVLSSIGHLNTVFGLLAPFFKKCKFVIREASVISVMNKFSTASSLYKYLSKVAFYNIDAVICQSLDMANDFKQIYGISSRKIAIINNPITMMYPLKMNDNIDNLTKLITIGRLSKEKGHERLLSKVEFPFQYTIVGTGPEEHLINRKIDDLGLNDKITLIPFTDKIGDILGSHDIFLQGSYVEGFPNAILESCVVGTPVVAFDCPGGTREIIEEDINGYLAKNNEDFLKKLTKINNRRWKPEDIRNSVIYKFNKQKILSQYEELLINL